MSDVLGQLMEEMAGFRNDPLGHVLYSYPWGEPGTELAGKSGPEQWQRDILERIGAGTLDLNTAVQEAIASGHGIGKSALVSWIILWGISTLEDTRGVVTANTENQLKTKTWAELGKWYRLFIARDLFVLTATALFAKDKLHQRTWRIDMVPWSEKNTEAFAGLHNAGRRVLLVFDEGSSIPDIIWETAEGALTDANTEIIWFVAGNPTKNSGRFYDCFHSLAHRWETRQIDSRSVTHTNKALFNKWIEDYGADSDFVRIRVLGKFPRIGESEFISAEAVRDAMSRDIGFVPEDEPIVLGVDVARFGKNNSVIWPRRGRDARSYPIERYNGLDTQELANKVVEAMRRYSTGLVAVDGGGVGGGVVDRLRTLGVDVIEVQFSSKPNPHGGREVARYANKRAELWGSIRDWLRGGALPDDPQVLEQLTSPRYTLNQQDAIQLERKDAMEARGAPSPDDADALAITFAVDTSYMYAAASLAGPLDVSYNPFEGTHEYV